MSELELADYRRRVADLYAAVRSTPHPVDAWTVWCLERDRLFAHHPQSPIGDQPAFTGLRYFEYDRAYRTVGTVEPLETASLDVAHSGEGVTRFLAVGTVRFTMLGRGLSLRLYWLDAYGGGLYLPFGDATNDNSTYRGGRYLLDAAKGADLGAVGSDLVLDFNFAYHPSCVYSPRWSCPLAPPGNRLDVPVTAGERL